VCRPTTFAQTGANSCFVAQYLQNRPSNFYANYKSRAGDGDKRAQSSFFSKENDMGGISK
jgi:hypothetical protein